MSWIRPLILAAGKQTRWEKKNPFGYRFKQLLPVGDESIINRIVRQCRERGAEPIVVSYHEEIIQATDAATFLIPSYAAHWTVETMQNSPWGTDRTVVLLGDVVYSKTVMDRIFACKNPIRVFGHEYEIFAINFEDGVRHNVRYALAMAIGLFALLGIWMFLR